MILGSGSIHNIGRFQSKSHNDRKAGARCQKCLQEGHWSYECKNEPVYLARPSKSQLLRKKKAALTQPTVELPPELQPDFVQKRNAEALERIRAEAEKRRQRKRRKREQSSSSSSSSGSESSSSGSGSSSSSGSDSGSSSDSSSDSSASDSDSDSGDERPSKPPPRKKADGGHARPDVTPSGRRSPPEDRRRSRESAGDGLGANAVRESREEARGHTDAPRDGRSRRPDVRDMRELLSRRPRGSGERAGRTDAPDSPPLRSRAAQAPAKPRLRSRATAVALDVAAAEPADDARTDAGPSIDDAPAAQHEPATAPGRRRAPVEFPASDAPSAARRDHEETRQAARRHTPITFPADLSSGAPSSRGADLVATRVRERSKDLREGALRERLSPPARRGDDVDRRDGAAGRRRDDRGGGGRSRDAEGHRRSDADERSRRERPRDMLAREGRPAEREGWKGGGSGEEDCGRRERAQGDVQRVGRGVRSPSPRGRRAERGRGGDQSSSGSSSDSDSSSAGGSATTSDSEALSLD